MWTASPSSSHFKATKRLTKREYNRTAVTVFTWGYQTYTNKFPMFYAWLFFFLPTPPTSAQSGARKSSLRPCKQTCKPPTHPYPSWMCSQRPDPHQTRPRTFMNEPHKHNSLYRWNRCTGQGGEWSKGRFVRGSWKTNEKWRQRFLSLTTLE